MVKRITIRLDDQVFADAMQLTAETGRSLTGVIEDALREMLDRQSRPAERPPVRLPIDAGRGLLPGVDLNSSAALLDLMDVNVLSSSPRRRGIKGPSA